jgi:sulfatase modifying factor 1
MKANLFLPLLLSVGLWGSADAAINIETVAIGDLGNPNDTTGFGGVNHGYAIGKYEVTILQYTSFLNAVATTDTYSLYNPDMGSRQTIVGIGRTGESGSYSYSVMGDGNRPVAYVSWFDAARFTNWLHNGQPSGLQAAGTTETGAYTLNGATTGLEFTKSLGAQYWIPSENEWYKAAYYQPAAAGGDADGYWKYPTASNEIPNSRNGSTTDANSANFFRNDEIDNGVNSGYAVTGSIDYDISKNYLTPGGAFTQADSYYGTFDQGGNVMEWNDAVVTTVRVLRGGSWINQEDLMRAGYQNIGASDLEDERTGFRIATVPEPSAGLSLIVTGAWMLSRRKIFSIL